MIRKSTLEDIPKLIEIFQCARRFMAEQGNPSQWNGNYPNEKDARMDIKQGIAYTIAREGQIIGTFALASGAEPTYQHIQGAWPNEEPYLTIHRLASDGSCHGIFAEMLAFCAEQKEEWLRIDTHENNHHMLRLMEKYGFTPCGVITVQDGTPRLAFMRKNRM